MTRHTTPLLALLASATLLAACQKPEKQDAGAFAAQQAQQPVTAPTATTAYASSKLSEADQQSVVARVNNEDITLGEYERRLDAQAPFARARYNSRERKLDFLNTMVQFEVLADEAQRLGYDRDPEVVLELKQAMVRRMMTDRISQAVKLEDITDAEIQTYYDAHREDYVRPAKVRASQIVVADEATARKVHQELLQGFKEHPTDKRKIFALKARDTSIDKPTAELGGDMRFFALPKDGGTVDPPVAEAAFALEHVGSITEPFQAKAGWTLVMLTGRKERFEKPLDEVKRTIQNRLFREKRAAKEAEMIESLKKGASITLHDDLLNRIPDPPPMPDADPHAHGEDGPKEPLIDDNAPEQQQP